MNTRLLLYIEPYVYVNINGNKALLLNCLNQNFLETDESNEIELVKKLEEHNRILEINEIIEKKPQFKLFINKLRRKRIGDLIEKQKFKNPIPFSPFLKLHDEKKIIKYSDQKRLEKLIESVPSRDKINLFRDKEVGENIIQTLSELNIYINNSFTDLTYKNAYSQVLFPRSEILGDLNFSLLNKLLHSICKEQCLVNIIGNYLNDYPYWNELFSLLKNENFNFQIHFHYKDGIITNRSILDVNKNIWITFPIEEKCMHNYFFINGIDEKTNLFFLIKDEKEFHLVQNMITKYKLNNVKIYPFYFANDFFCKEALAYSKKDLLNSKILEKHIYINQIVNRNNFGSITILNNGDAHSNVNDPSIGNIKNNSLHQLLFHELKNGISWKRTRNTVEPCKDCLYSNICPPITNIELSTKKFNYCNF